MPKRRIPLPSFKTTLIITVVVIYTVTLTSLFASILNSYRSFQMPSFGTIYALGYDVYDGDIITVNGNKTLNWTTVYVGSSMNRSFLLKSISSTVTKPNFAYGNWTFRDVEDQKQPSPRLDSITVDWNLRKDTLLNPNEVVNVTLTLRVEYNETFVQDIIKFNITTFSFDMAIYPSQV
jgi:hypothetical protein